MNMNTNGVELEYNFVNTEAEKQVIGGIIMDAGMMESCILKPQWLYDTRHSNILYIMQKLKERNEPIEVGSIIQFAANAKKVDKIGGISYIAELAQSIPTNARFDYYQGIVIDYYKKRETYRIAKELMMNVLSEDYEAERRKTMLALATLDDLVVGEEDDGHISKAVQKVYERALTEQGGLKGTSTGYKGLDFVISGWQKQKLIILGARPSMGKTTFASNLIELYSALAASKNPTVFFSIEEPDEAVVDKMISSTGNIRSEKMKNPFKNFDEKDWDRFSHSTGILSHAKIHIKDKSSVTLEYIRRESRKIKNLYPDEHLLIVIDYLQIIKGDPMHKGNKNAEMTDISVGLKQLARDLDATVIALSQLSRDVERRQDKRPMNSDLKDSGTIEAAADVIIFLYRDDYYDRESERKGITEIIISKNRNGPLAIIEMAFQKELSKFLELDKVA